MKYVLGVLVALLFSGCASMTKPVSAVPHTWNLRNSLVRTTDNMNPKQLKAKLGQPFMVAFDKKNSNKYLMAYPISDGQVSTWDVISSKPSMDCTIFEFRREKNFVRSWEEIYEQSCELVKDDFNGYDESLIKD